MGERGRSGVRGAGGGYGADGCGLVGLVEGGR